MYHFIHCDICQDKKKFRLKVQDAQRILYRLRELSSLIPRDFELSNEDEFKARGIQYKSYPHFMCGHCPKVNIHELHNLEEQILLEAYRLFAFAKQDTTAKNIRGKIKGDCQRLLSGFYPNIAALFYHRL
jgi:hypothetical protein